MSEIIEKKRDIKNYPNLPFLGELVLTKFYYDGNLMRFSWGVWASASFFENDQPKLQLPDSDFEIAGSLFDGLKTQYSQVFNLLHSQAVSLAELAGNETFADLEIDVLKTLLIIGKKGEFGGRFTKTAIDSATNTEFTDVMQTEDSKHLWNGLTGILINYCAGIERQNQSIFQSALEYYTQNVL